MSAASQIICECPCACIRDHGPARRHEVRPRDRLAGKISSSNARAGRRFRFMAIPERAVKENIVCSTTTPGELVVVEVIGLLHDGISAVTRCEERWKQQISPHRCRGKRGSRPSLCHKNRNYGALTSLSCQRKVKRLSAQLVKMCVRLPEKVLRLCYCR